MANKHIFRVPLSSDRTFEVDLDTVLRVRRTGVQRQLREHIPLEAGVKTMYQLSNDKLISLRGELVSGVITQQQYEQALSLNVKLKLVLDALVSKRAVLSELLGCSYLVVPLWRHNTNIKTLLNGRLGA